MNNNNNLPIIFGGNNPHHPLLAHFGNINVPLNSPAENQIIAMQRRQTLNDVLAQVAPDAVTDVPLGYNSDVNIVHTGINNAASLAQTVGASISNNPIFQGGYSAGGNVLLNYVNSGFVYLQQTTHLDTNPATYSFRAGIIRGVGFVGVISLSFMMGYLTGEMLSSPGSLN